MIRGDKRARGFTAVIVASLLLIASLLVGLLLLDSGEARDDRIGIVVSILPQAEFAESIGGERVDVTVMVQPGADPHSYEPTPSQMRALERAEIYFKIGSGLDFELAWMDRFAELNPTMTIVDGSAGVPLIQSSDSHHGGIDPHIWLSPVNVKTMVGNLLDALVSLDPANESYYRGNAEQYVFQLDELDDELSKLLAPHWGGLFLTYHPAWGYFADRYGLQQIAIEEDGKEPTAQHLAEIIDIAVENGLSVVFVSPGFSTRAAEEVATEIGGELVAIDPLAEDYISNLRHVAVQLAISLEV